MRFTGTCDVCGNSYLLGFGHVCPGRWTAVQNIANGPAEILPGGHIVGTRLPDELASIDPAELLKAWEFYQEHKSDPNPKPVTKKRQISATEKKSRAEYQKRWRQSRAQKAEENAG